MRFGFSLKDAEPEANLLLLRDEELLPGDGAADSPGERISSLSSSLIVSSIFGVLCLMTLTNCGGATSVTNLASPEFIIFACPLNCAEEKGKMKKMAVLVMKEHLRLF